MTDLDHVRAALAGQVADRDWAALTWSALLDALQSIGRRDIVLARLAEGHIDAHRILGEAGHTPKADALYAVWASRSHATGLRGRPLDDGSWCLNGILRFASGAGIVTRALVPVWTSPDEHVLLDLEVADWPFEDTWKSSAMRDSRSLTVTWEQRRQQADVVGPEGFYLGRPGFFRGGIGVAACWAGGARRLVELLDTALPAEHRTPAQVVRRGRAVAEVALCRRLLEQSALALVRLDPTHDGRRLSTETRFLIAESVRRVIGEVTAIAGPGLLAFDADLTAAVDDLRLYVAQENPDSDAAALGGSVS